MNAFTDVRSNPFGSVQVLFSLNQLENHELVAAGSDPAKSPVRNRRDTISALR
jgi:hypothetical protein